MNASMSRAYLSTADAGLKVPNQSAWIAAQSLELLPGTQPQILGFPRRDPAREHQARVRSSDHQHRLEARGTDFKRHPQGRNL